MRVLVIDGMGGGIGKAVIEQLKKGLPQLEIFAFGTNSTATAAMLKAGASVGATGENAIIYNCEKAGESDLIIGAIGIVLANSLCGEITPLMACAVSSSTAHKLLIPVAKCNTTVLTTGDQPLATLLSEVVQAVKSRL